MNISKVFSVFLRNFHPSTEKSEILPQKAIHPAKKDKRQSKSQNRKKERKSAKRSAPETFRKRCNLQQKIHRTEDRKLPFSSAKYEKPFRKFGNPLEKYEKRAIMPLGNRPSESSLPLLTPRSFFNGFKLAYTNKYRRKGRLPRKDDFCEGIRMDFLFTFIFIPIC